jgi:hypothetical protein
MATSDEIEGVRHAVNYDTNHLQAARRPGEG